MKVYHKEQKDDHNKNDLNFNIDYSEVTQMVQSGLLSLAVNVGLKAIQTLMEQEVNDTVGPKGARNKSRNAYRHGHESTQVVLGGQKISMDKPRMRSIEGHDIPLDTLKKFQSEDPLTQSVLNRLLAGVSTRSYNSTLDTNIDAAPAKGVSKSSVSRKFIQITKKQMEEFLSRSLSNKYYPVLMIDGVSVGEHIIITALGIDTEGHKQILGMEEGATENAAVCKHLLSDLIERGLTTEEGILVVIDGSKALGKAVKDTFGSSTPIQRCQIHKIRNVKEHLPESEQQRISRKIKKAYLEPDYDKAHKALNNIVKELEITYPGAASSLKEGLEETLTVHKLRVPGLLRVTLSTTNPIESANSIARSTSYRVKRWQNGEQALRWIATGMMAAEEKFRKIKGYKQIPVLMAALNQACRGESNTNISHIA